MVKKSELKNRRADDRDFTCWFKQQKFSLGAIPNWTVEEHMRRAWCEGRASLRALDEKDVAYLEEGT